VDLFLLLQLRMLSLARSLGQLVVPSRHPVILGRPLLLARSYSDQISQSDLEKARDILTEGLANGSDSPNGGDLLYNLAFIEAQLGMVSEEFRVT